MELNQPSDLPQSTPNGPYRVPPNAQQMQANDTAAVIAALAEELVKIGQTVVTQGKAIKQLQAGMAEAEQAFKQLAPLLQAVQQAQQQPQNVPAGSNPASWQPPTAGGMGGIIQQIIGSIMEAVKGMGNASAGGIAGVSYDMAYMDKEILRIGRMRILLEEKEALKRAYRERGLQPPPDHVVADHP